MRNDMKRFIKIVETAEFDYAQRDMAKATTYPSYDEFTRRGASYRIKRNDPRFGDNPLEDAAALTEDADEPLTPDEFRGWCGQMPPDLRETGKNILDVIESAHIDLPQMKMLYSVLHAMCANTSVHVMQGNANEEVVSAIRYAQRESGVRLDIADRQVQNVVGLLRLFARKIETMHMANEKNQARSGRTMPMSMHEDVQSPQLVRLHTELNKVVSDEEIKAGLSLSQNGLHKLAGMLGVGPQDVHVLLSSLTQNLRDDDAAMEEDYHAYMEAAADQQAPFADDPDDADLSLEQDALGSDTVRSATTGKSKFVQGSTAAELEKKLAQPGADRQNVLRTMMAEAEEESFDGEIQADTGSYNFPWKLAGRHGFATAFFRRDSAVPELKITSVSDAEGNEIDLPQEQRHALTQQALAFIGDA
jgi:hypothetical protein